MALIHELLPKSMPKRIKVEGDIGELDQGVQVGKVEHQIGQVAKGQSITNINIIIIVY